MPLSARTPVRRAGPLDEARRASYRSVGHVVLPGVVPAPFLDRARFLLEARVDDVVARWRATGLLEDDHADLPFATRYWRAWSDAGRPGDAAVTHADLAGTPAGRALVAQPWLLDLAAAALGTASATPVPSCLFRAKFPGDARTDLPWHQDVQCVGHLAGPDFVTIWVPLVDVPPHGSCLEVAPLAGERRAFPPVWSERSGYVCMRAADAEGLGPTRTLPMRRGDALLMDPFLPHRSLGNSSRGIRWSLDLRYAPG